MSDEIIKRLDTAHSLLIHLENLRLKFSVPIMSLVETGKIIGFQWIMPEAKEQYDKSLQQLIDLYKVREK